MRAALVVMVVAAVCMAFGSPARAEYGDLDGGGKAWWPHFTWRLPDWGSPSAWRSADSRGNGQEAPVGTARAGTVCGDSALGQRRVSRVR